MAQANGSHVYVGAARITGGSLGGVVRQTVGDDRWERLSKGLPDSVQVQAITVHPTDHNVVFLGTASAGSACPSIRAARCGRSWCTRPTRG